MRVEAEERSRLGHLCRYIARPPLSSERSSRSRRGKVVLALRAPFRDGFMAIGSDPNGDPIALDIKSGAVVVKEL